MDNMVKNHAEKAVMDNQAKTRNTMVAFWFRLDGGGGFSIMAIECKLATEIWAGALSLG